MTKGHQAGSMKVDMHSAPLDYLLHPCCFCRRALQASGIASIRFHTETKGEQDQGHSRRLNERYRPMVRKKQASTIQSPAPFAHTIDMARDEQYPIIPHEISGVDCDGCLVVRVRGDQADIVCNECKAVLRTVPVEQATSMMVEIASGEICSARCTSCAL